MVGTMAKDERSPPFCQNVLCVNGDKNRTVVCKTYKATNGSLKVLPQGFPKIVMSKSYLRLERNGDSVSELR